MKKFNLFNVVFFRQFAAVMTGMFVFGFVDNFILVIAGDMIDNTISSTFGFSTMFSAGLGNTLSDAIGVLLGSIMARLVYNLFGEVTKDDIGNKTFLAAEVIGIIIGCLAGMTPLVFI
jgi:hypothetical protein